jgi:hypothetical protein
MRLRRSSPIASWLNWSLWKPVDGLNSERRTAEYRKTNFEGWNRYALSVLKIKIDRMPSFDI